MRNPRNLRLFLAAGVAFLAFGSAVQAESTASLDNALDLFRPRTSFAGNYLAARSADRQQDIGAAARFYNSALVSDPQNPALIERALLLSIANNDMARAFSLAEEMITLDPGSPAARVSLAVQAVKENRTTSVEANLDAMAPADLASLTAGLMRAWVAFGEGRTDDAIKLVDGLRGPEWYDVFKNYHTALIYDAAGRTKDAAAAIKRAYTNDTTALRVVDAYARIMTRDGKRDEAVRALIAFAGEHPLHPAVRVLLDDIRAGKFPAPTAGTTETGIAEVLYGLGSAIGIDDGMELAAAYLRLSSYLDPNAHLVTMALGDVFQASERCDDAIAIYEGVPASDPLRRNADIQIANCYQTMEKPEEAIRYIKRVLDRDPGDYEAAMELGNVYRADEQYALAAEAYTTGIATMPDPSKADWRVYYFRGIAYERIKKWPEAEADFRTALKLEPEQPQVLNYLGYSWVDQGMNLDEALKMIKRAVELRPNDGYIVDSLGWAYYRLGRNQDAVKSLEEAVSLNAADPVINDHLGDAYWTVGRKREAVFQWSHARDLDPAEADLPKILAKLEHGLDGKPEDVTLLPSGGVSNDAAGVVKVAPGESLSDIAQRVYGDAGQYQRILDANKDKITNPNVITPGMTLTVPPLNGAN